MESLATVEEIYEEPQTILNALKIEKESVVKLAL